MGTIQEEYPEMCIHGMSSWRLCHYCNHRCIHCGKNQKRLDR